jgi:NitT/TauT family transport system substrate-binding protein
MKKLIILFVIVSILIVGCAPAEEVPKTSGEVMKVATNYWPGNYWIDIADANGWFTEAGLNVELVDTSGDFIGGIEDLAEGKIDVAQPVLYDLIKFVVEGNDLVMVVNTDISNGADILVSKKDIGGTYDLKGRVIGVQQNTFEEYLLNEFLRHSGLTSDDITIREVSSENVKPFVDGTVDAFMSWGPHASEAIKDGDGKNLVDSSLTLGLLPEGVAFHRKFIEEKPEDVQAYVNVWHKTTQFIKDNPKEAFEVISERYGVPIGEVQDFLQDDKILDLQDNKIAFSYAAGFESLHGTAKQINKFMKKNGITDKDLDSTEFIDARFIRGVES